MLTWYLPPHFSSIRHVVQKEMFLWFLYGCHSGHLRYQTVAILAILNLRIVLMPPNKFNFNPTYDSRGDGIWRSSIWLPLQPTWISQKNTLRNYESPYCPDPSNQVSVQPTIRCGRISKISMWLLSRSYWISDQNNFSDSHSFPLMPLTAPYQVSAQSNFWFW